MPMLAKIKKNILFIGSTAGNYLMFLPVFRVFRQRYPKITSKDTDVCIDGFPRSGNTYFVSAFLSWNDALSVSHHTHLAGSVMFALKRDIPTVVLIRRPEDVLPSVLVWDDLLSTTIALASYIHFYRALWKYRNKFLILCFDDVTKEPDNCVQKINQRFNRRFKSVEFSAEEDEKIRARLKKVDIRHSRAGANSSLPNTGKSQLKKKYLASLLDNPLHHYANRLFLNYSELRDKQAS